MLIGGVGIGVGIFIGKHHIKGPGEADGAESSTAVTTSESTQDTGLESAPQLRPRQSLTGASLGEE